MTLTEEQFRAMMPNGGSRLDSHWPYVNPALERFDITTPERIAAFMAQLAHESGEYRYMEEIWGPTEAQLGYEGRADLGNTEPGDGEWFKGHGPIQITGRANHQACGDALGLDLITVPRLICTPQYGTDSAAWFWSSRGLSPLADLGWFTAISKIINGGTNGLSDRWRYYNQNRDLLGLSPLYPINEMGAIKEWQASHGLVDDGVVGPKTMATITDTAGTEVLYPPAPVETPPPSAPRILRKGDSGPDVAALQAKLFQIDGQFGSVTEAALRQFQRDHGLLGDGIAGPQTREALGMEA